MVCDTRREEISWNPSLRVQIAVEVMLTGYRDNTVYQTLLYLLSLLFLFLFLSFFCYVKDPNSSIRHEPALIKLNFKGMLIVVVRLQ